MPRDITNIYQELCSRYDFPFHIEKSVRSYDDTTLFCPAGMQKYKKDFANHELKDKTVANIQSCLRLVDYDEIGDGTHCLCFNMIGLFSFRDITLEKAIQFWMDYMKELEIKIDFVTIHPDKFQEWKSLYDSYQVEVREDPDCSWSDGTSPKAYCTEFYHIKDGLEIEDGNIVNPQNGTCIDAGFGFERLDSIVNGIHLENPAEVMAKAIKKLLDSDFKPTGQKHGSILRRLYRDFIKKGYQCDQEHSLMVEWHQKEIDRMEKAKKKYARLQKKHQDKPKEFWMSTFGIDLEEMKELESLESTTIEEG